ncbi:hypothetical protein AB0B09_41270, partial [Streptomyces sp. NPDC044948]
DPDWQVYKAYGLLPDDCELASPCRPRPALGAEAVRLLAARIAGGPAEGTLVACAFRPGATAGPPTAPRTRP